MRELNSIEISVVNGASIGDVIISAGRTLMASGQVAVGATLVVVGTVANAATDGDG